MQVLSARDIDVGVVGGDGVGVAVIAAAAAGSDGSGGIVYLDG